jgi:hypothetical protein
LERLEANLQKNKMDDDKKIARGVKVEPRSYYWSAESNIATFRHHVIDAFQHCGAEALSYSTEYRAALHALQAKYPNLSRNEIDALIKPMIDSGELQKNGSLGSISKATLGFYFTTKTEWNNTDRRTPFPDFYKQKALATGEEYKKKKETQKNPFATHLNIDMHEELERITGKNMVYLSNNDGDSEYDRIAAPESSHAYDISKYELLRECGVSQEHLDLYADFEKQIEDKEYIIKTSPKSKPNGTTAQQRDRLIRKQAKLVKEIMAKLDTTTIDFMRERTEEIRKLENDNAPDSSYFANSEGIIGYGGYEGDDDDDDYI